MVLIHNDANFSTRPSLNLDSYHFCISTILYHNSEDAIDAIHHQGRRSQVHSCTLSPRTMSHSSVEMCSGDMTELSPTIPSTTSLCSTHLSMAATTTSQSTTRFSAPAISSATTRRMGTTSQRPRTASSTTLKSTTKPFPLQQDRFAARPAQVQEDSARRLQE